MEREIKRDWSQLPSELLELVVSKLHFMDIPRFNGVCSSWHAASNPHCRFPPLLMLPPKVPQPQFPPLLTLSSTIDDEDKDEKEFEEKSGTKRYRFLNPHDIKKKIILYVPPSRKPGAGKYPPYAGSGEGSCCVVDRLVNQDYCVVGSSHGWVVILVENGDLFLLNPFLGSKIELPKKTTFPHIHALPRLQVFDTKIVRTETGTVPESDPIGGVYDSSIPVVQKAILTANPSCGNEYKVVIVYGFPAKLAFCSRGDKAWTALSDSQYFTDVACDNNELYAIQFTLGAGVEIHKWDISSYVGNPRKSSHIVIPSLTRELDNLIERFGSIRYSFQFYVVPSVEETFLVVRFVGTWDKACGIVVDYADLFLDQSHLANPYITPAFDVYKVDPDHQKKLVKVESLPGQAMFLGRNHSAVIKVAGYQPALKENSIYFTDDDWEEVNVHHRYGGHDIGIYCLEDRSISLLCDLQSYKPAPFWVFRSWK